MNILPENFSIGPINLKDELLLECFKLIEEKDSYNFGGFCDYLNNIKKKDNNKWIRICNNLESISKSGLMLFVNEYSKYGHSSSINSYQNKNIGLKNFSVIHIMDIYFGSQNKHSIQQLPNLTPENQQI